MISTDVHDIKYRLMHSVLLYKYYLCAVALKTNPPPPRANHIVLMSVKYTLVSHFSLEKNRKLTK